jgi:hypothetical protein
MVRTTGYAGAILYVVHWGSGFGSINEKNGRDYSRGASVDVAALEMVALFQMYCLLFFYFYRHQ